MTVIHTSPVLYQEQPAESVISRQSVLLQLDSNAVSDCDIVTVCWKQTPLLLQLNPEHNAWLQTQEKDTTQLSLRGKGRENSTC